MMSSSNNKKDPSGKTCGDLEEGHNPREKDEQDDDAKPPKSAVAAALADMTVENKNLVWRQRSDDPGGDECLPTFKDQVRERRRPLASAVGVPVNDNDEGLQQQQQRQQQQQPATIVAEAEILEPESSSRRLPSYCTHLIWAATILGFGIIVAVTVSLKKSSSNGSNTPATSLRPTPSPSSNATLTTAPATAPPSTIPPSITESLSPTQGAIPTKTPEPISESPTLSPSVSTEPPASATESSSNKPTSTFPSSEPSAAPSGLPDFNSTEETPIAITFSTGNDGTLLPVNVRLQKLYQSLPVFSFHIVDTPMQVNARQTFTFHAPIHFCEVSRMRISLSPPKWNEEDDHWFLSGVELKIGGSVAFVNKNVDLNIASTGHLSDSYYVEWYASVEYLSVCREWTTPSLPSPAPTPTWPPSAGPSIPISVTIVAGSDGTTDPLTVEFRYGGTYDIEGPVLAGRTQTFSTRASVEYCGKTDFRLSKGGSQDSAEDDTLYIIELHVDVDGDVWFDRVSYRVLTSSSWIGGGWSGGQEYIERCLTP